MSLPQEEQETVAEVQEPALPGQRLQKTREDMRLSRDEVAHHLHLDVQVVKALEEDNFASLPSPAYVCGYLRSYARMLKLSENEIVNSYRKGQDISSCLVPDNIDIKPSRVENPAVKKNILIFLLVAALLVIAVVAVEKFDLLNKKQPGGSEQIPLVTPTEEDKVETPLGGSGSPQPADSSASDHHSVSPTAAAPTDTSVSDDSAAASGTADSAGVVPVENVAPALTDGDLKFVYHNESWTAVTDAKGIRHLYRMVPKGSELFVQGMPPYQVRLGVADAVEVFYKGKLYNHKPYQKPDSSAYFRVGAAEVNP